MELLATVYRILMILFTVSLVQSQDEEMEIPCDNSLGLCLWGDLEDEGSGQLLEGFGSGGETGAESGDEFGIVPEFGCRNNILCKRQGGFCISSFNMDRQCDVRIPNLCGKRRCSCCMKKECMQSSWCSIFGGRCVAKSECRSSINSNAFMCPGIDCTCCRGRDWWCERSGGFCTHAECASGLMGRMCSDGGNCCVPMMEILDDDTAADE